MLFIYQQHGGSIFSLKSKSYRFSKYNMCMPQINKQLIWTVISTLCAHEIGKLHATEKRKYEMNLNLISLPV